MSDDVERVLEAYEKDGDGFLFEVPLRNFDLVKFKALFGVQDDDPLMYLQYAVREEHVTLLREHVDDPIEVDRFEYFISARAAHE